MFQNAKPIVPREWHSQYQCIPYDISPQERQLMDLADKFVEEVEAADLLICRHSVRGVGVPSNGEEMQLIDKNYREAMARYLELALQMGCKKQLWQDHVKRANERFDRRHR